MDKIKLIGVEIYGHHGVTPMERESGQKFQIDVELHLDLSQAGESDDVRDTVDYRGVYRVIEEVTRERRYCLIEAMGADIVKAIFREHPRIVGVTVRVRKPGVAIGGILQHAMVEIERTREEDGR